MSWKNKYQLLSMTRESRGSIDSLSTNYACFIRKVHKCDKLFGASKSCFIACPTDEEINPILELISEKLTKFGIEPIIAVRERAYGQDIFCTKICGKIIESKFCIVILNDTIKNLENIPNPNVYYEYGLMTSLRKHIIPLQKDNLKLAFNIQSYDTIKYNNRNIAIELDRAIKDAIRITEQPLNYDVTSDLNDKSILRRFELAGFDLKDDDWFMYYLIEDTNFKGFGQQEKMFYLYLGKIDEENELSSYLEDLGVILYRTEKKFKEITEEHKILINNISAENEKIENKRKENKIYNSLSLNRMIKQERDLNEKLLLMSNFYIGFIVKSGLNMTNFIKKVKALLSNYERYKLVYNKSSEIKIGEIKIKFEENN